MSESNMNPLMGRGRKPPENNTETSSDNPPMEPMINFRQFRKKRIPPGTYIATDRPVGNRDAVGKILAIGFPSQQSVSGLLVYDFDSEQNFKASSKRKETILKFAAKYNLIFKTKTVVSMNGQFKISPR